MTTRTEGTDPARPNVNDPAQPPAPVVAQDPPAPPPAPIPEPVVVDIDELELQELRAAAKAEEAAAQNPGPQPVEGQQPPAPPAAAPPPAPQPSDQQQPTGQQPPAEPPMIPKARFDEVNSRASKAEQDKAKAETDAAYWRGVAEARAQQQQPGAAAVPGLTPPEPPKTAEQRIAEIRTQKLAIAKQFDDGEIRAAEMHAQHDTLDDQIAVIREEALLSKVKPADPAAPAQPDQSLYLETLTAQLEADHRWVGVAEQVGSQADWAYIRDRAVENLVGRGIDPSVKTDVNRYELRKEMALLWDDLGPGLLTRRATDKGITLPGQQVQQPPAPPPAQPPAPAAPAGSPQPTLSQVAKSRLAKLDLAAGAPPSLAAIPGSNVDPGALSDSQIDVMSEDDIGKLPDATRRKMMGII